MKLSHLPTIPDSGFGLNLCFELTFFFSLFVGIPISVLNVFHSLEHGSWPIMAYGHAMALLWLLLGKGWIEKQEKVLKEIPERGLEQAYRHAEMGGQRSGMRLVIWGVVIGSWVVMVAGWVLAAVL